MSRSSDNSIVSQAHRRVEAEDKAPANIFLLSMRGGANVFGLDKKTDRKVTILALVCATFPIWGWVILLLIFQLSFSCTRISRVTARYEDM